MDQGMSHPIFLEAPFLEDRMTYMLMYSGIPQGNLLHTLLTQKSKFMIKTPTSYVINH